MTIPDVFSLAVVGLQIAGLVYAGFLGFRARRARRDANAHLLAARSNHTKSEAQLERIGAFLTHLMEQHGVLHSPHSHDDDDSPSIH